MTDDPHARSLALGAELVRVHDQLREQLDLLQQAMSSGDLAAYDAGPTSFATRCLAFCAALRAHHEGEDDALFPALVAAHPELAPVVESLRSDHYFLAGLLVSLEALVTRWREAGTAGDRTAFVRELDGIAALMENHFAYEERALVSLLG